MRARGPSRCPAEGCNRPHHVTLHGILKAGKSSPPEGSTDPPDELAAAAAYRTPEMARQLRGLLEGLGIDPGALEVRIGIRKPGEPGRLCGGETTEQGVAGAGVGKLTSRLLEALTSLCQAGERFVDSAAESGQRMIGTADPTAIPRRSARRERSRSAARSRERAPRRSSSWTTRQELAMQDGEDSAEEIGDKRRALEGSKYIRGNQGSLERYGGLQRVVLLTPDGGQLINMGNGRGFVFSVVSQKTAARYAVHRSKFPAPLMVDGPSNQKVRATEHCTIAFPQEKAVGGKMIIYAFVVDTLEEYYETPGDGLQRWQMQLGEEDEGFLQWLRVAQPGDRPHYELTLEDVTLDLERGGEPIHVEVPRVQGAADDGDSVAHGSTGVEHARVTAVGNAAARLGLTERPNDWCQVRPCNTTGRQEDGFLAKIASVLEIAPGYPTERRPREMNFRKPDVVIGTRD